MNKVESAVLLRFNVVQTASLPDAVRERLLKLTGQKMTLEGDLIIKASRFRTQERNKVDALARLVDMIRKASVIPKKRKKTKPTKASIQRRLKGKKLHSNIKALRGKKSILD